MPSFDTNYLIVFFTALFAGVLTFLRNYDEDATEGLNPKKAFARFLLSSLTSAGYVVAFFEILNYVGVSFGASLAIAGALSCASGNLTGKIIVAVTEKFLQIKIDKPCDKED